MRRAHFRSSLHALAVILLILSTTLPSLAATWTVTNTSDKATNTGSLRYALSQAQNGDTIVFSLPNHSIIKLTSQLTIATNVTISGPGASSLAISGTFGVYPSATATISGLTIKNGKITNAGVLTVSDTTFSSSSLGNGSNATLTVNNSTFSGNSATYGGGIGNGDFSTATVSNSTFSGISGSAIGNNGFMTVSNSTFSGNSATYGGAIYNIDEGAAVTVSNSTFSGNSATYGGAIYNDNTAFVYVSNSTFSGNSATYGGGIDNNGLFLEGPQTYARVVNSTFSGNSATYGGGIYNPGLNPSTLTLKGTLLANEPTGGNCYLDGGDATSDGYNLSDDNTCSFLTGSGDQNDVATAGLSPSGLQNNGGPTQTIALLSTSPAVNAIPVNPINECTDAYGNLVTTDQRDVPRPQGPGCDIGAYELVQGQPYGLVSPTTVNFGSVLIGQTSPQKLISLKNIGTVELTVSDISISGDFALPVNRCAEGVKPGTHCNVEITFTPHTPGTQTGTLTFTDNALNSPQTVSLTGYGTE